MKRNWYLLMLLLVSSFSWGYQLPDTLHVGIIKYKTEEKLITSYTPLITHIGSELGIPAQLHIVSDEQLGYDLTQGKYQIGIFKPFPYLNDKVTFPQLEVFASHTVEYEAIYQGIILVKKESNIDLLSDLKGKKFLFIKPTSTSGYRYPKGIFKEHDIDIESGFFSFEFSYDHEKAFEALFNDEVDGIAVSKKAVLGHPDYKVDQYQILSEYEVPFQAYVFTPDLDIVTKNKIKEIMFNAHKNPANQALFNNPLGISRWVKQGDKYYNYLRRYLRIMRVKPSFNLSFELKTTAQEHLNSKGDIIDIIMDNTVNELLSSQRFEGYNSTEESANNISIVLSMIEAKQFHYQVYLNKIRIAESDILENALTAQLPNIAAASVLLHLPLQSKLLNNGTDWFITFGSNDGMNSINYQFGIKNEKGELEYLEIKSITELNTYFENPDVDGNEVTIQYISDEFSEDQISMLDQIDVSNFWRDNFWDKLGLIVGIIIALASGFFGWLFNSRKKRRFKNMLRETNELLKEYYEDKIKLDQKIIELQDHIGGELEKGSITENQFLILKNKLDEVEKKINDNPNTENELDKILKQSGIENKD